jgi:hypothetical protein
MKKMFNQLLLELASTSEYVMLNPQAEGLGQYEYRGRRVIDTRHAVARYAERNVVKTDEFASFLKKCIDWLKSNGSTNLHYLFYSRSLEQGIVAAYEPDTVNFGLTIKPSPLNHMVILTVLPPRKQEEREGSKPTKKILMESTSYTPCSDEVSSYLANIFEVTITEEDMNLDGVHMHDKNIDGREYIYITYKDKMWDFHGATIVEIN